MEDGALADLTSATWPLREAAAWTAEAFGKIDILFANAGIQAFKPILELEDADWQDQIDANLTGTCNAIRDSPCWIMSSAAGAAQEGAA